MAGMLRCKDDKEFDALLKGSHVRVHKPGGIRHVAADPLVRVDARGRTKKAPSGTQVDTKKSASANEDLLAGQISACGNLPAPERQYHHLRGRAHTLDFAWPDLVVNGMQIGVEVQGMCHTVRERFNADIEKRALGVLQGWLILEVGPDQIKSGKAMEWLQALFTRAVRKP